MFCSLKLFQSNGVIELPVSVVVSVKINRKLYLQSDTLALSNGVIVFPVSIVFSVKMNRKPYFLINTLALSKTGSGPCCWFSTFSDTKVVQGNKKKVLVIQLELSIITAIASIKQYQTPFVTLEY